MCPHHFDHTSHVAYVLLTVNIQCLMGWGGGGGGGERQRSSCVEQIYGKCVILPGSLRGVPSGFCFSFPNVQRASHLSFIRIDIFHGDIFSYKASAANERLIVKYDKRLLKSHQLFSMNTPPP